MKISEAIAKYGSAEISNGTLRVQDLIPAYLEALRELAPNAYQQCMACGFPMVPSYALEDSDSEWWESMSADNALEYLSDALNEYAPEGYTFGSHEGDGACMGFWKVDS